MQETNIHAVGGIRI